MSEKIPTIKQILGENFPEHICNDIRPKTDLGFKIKIKKDRDPPALIIYKFFTEPRIIKKDKKYPSAQKKMRRFNMKNDIKPVVVKKTQRGIMAEYDAIPVQYCPFCGDKIKPVQKTHLYK